MATITKYPTEAGWQAPVCITNITCGLSPRARLQETLDRLRRNIGPDEQLALLLLDIDRFKSVRDLCGPAGSDTVLSVVALERLGGLERVWTLHLAADMFICLLPFSGGTESVTDFAEKVQQAIAQPIRVGKNVVHLTASLGIAIDQTGVGKADNLLHAASIALTDARNAQRNGISQYKEAMMIEVGLRAELEYDFRTSLACGEILPYYQPIISLKTGKPKGFEALARWAHPDRGIISPGSFLNIADELGLDRDLLFMMVRQACRDALDWPSHTTVSINITPSQLCDPTIAPELLKIVHASGMAPERLIIEITEVALMHSVKRAGETVHLLRSAGVSIALDDFGSGYASLQRLCSLEIDLLKIDKSLIQSLDREAGRKLVNAVVELGNTLSMPVTAEGIETIEQARFMQGVKCAYGQGYLFGRPAPADVARKIAAGGEITLG